MAVLFGDYGKVSWTEHILVITLYHTWKLSIALQTLYTVKRLFKMFFTQNGYFKYCSWKVFFREPKMVLYCITMKTSFLGLYF